MHNPVSLCNGRIVHRRLVFFAWSITTGQLEKPGDRSEYTVAWNLVLGTRQHPLVQFDYLGKNKQTFTQIHAPTLVGRDYLQRRIVITRVEVLVF